MTRLRLLLPAVLLAAHGLVVSGCAPDVVGGTRQIEEDCEYGCEVEREDPYGDGGEDDGAGGGDDGATTGTGGAPGAGGAGGDGGAGDGGAGGAGGG